ncbi:MAG: hypothetical protein ACTMKV_02115 [Sphingomonas parapaucimobilis]
MTFEDALQKRVIAIPGIVARVPCIGWSARLTGLPAIRLQVIADPRPQTMKGFQRGRPTMVQIDVYAKDRAEAVALRNLCIAQLTPSAQVDAVHFQRATVDNVRPGSEPEQSGDPQRYRGELPRESIDFTFMHNA